MRKRYLTAYVDEICFQYGKMAFLGGPRQAGKTTLSKQLLRLRGSGAYYSWDELKFRRLWADNPSAVVPTEVGELIPLVVLDEIHKAKKWKQNIKGVYDTLESACDILVTGSAKLNVYRKGSDSLMGRYFYFRLHPFSLAEMLNHKVIVDPDNLWESLIERRVRVGETAVKYFKQLDVYGPFPEPLFIAKKNHLNLWRRGRVEKIVREDLRDLSRTLELSQIEMLVSLLPDRVGSPLSKQSLGEDLEVSYTTVKRWMNYLYELYYCFEIKPYANSSSRAIRKQGKLYLWDWSEVDDEGHRFENLMANHLLKYCDFLTDTGVGLFALNYLKNKQKNEIDFLVVKDGKPWLPIEVKLSDELPSRNWHVFFKQLPVKVGVQVVKKPGVYKLHPAGEGQVLVVSADYFLAYLI